LIWLFASQQFHGVVAFLELRCSPWCHAPWLRLSIFGLLSGFALFFWVCVSNHSLGTGANHYQVIRPIILLINEWVMGHNPSLFDELHNPF
jgi:hypothetical protein